MTRRKALVGVAAAAIGALTDKPVKFHMPDPDAPLDLTITFRFRNVIIQHPDGDVTIPWDEIVEALR